MPKVSAHTLEDQMIRGLARARVLLSYSMLMKLHIYFYPINPAVLLDWPEGSTPMCVTSPVDGTMMLLPRPCSETPGNEHWYGQMTGRSLPSQLIGDHTETPTEWLTLALVLWRLLGLPPMTK